MTLLALALPLLVGCSDYDIKGQDPDDPVDTDIEDTAPPIDTATETGTTPPPEETCNGLDDDGDGAVDEDFGDMDGDGVVDCFDDDCEVTTLEAGVAPAPVCTGTGTAVVTDPWNVRTAWSFYADASLPSLMGAAHAPLVLQTDDDDGDGDVDADDVPDVLAMLTPNSGSTASLVTLDGATGAFKHAWGGFYWGGQHAVGDIDGDGLVEAVGFDSSNRAFAVDDDGSEMWKTATLTPYIGGMPGSYLADIDGDGVVEVFAENVILDGSSGTVLATLPASGHYYNLHVVADLDLDGVSEILFDGHVYHADGTELWAYAGVNDDAAPFAAVVQADADPEGEVVWIDPGWFGVYDTDGALLASYRLPTADPAPPCVANLDGDAVAEIVVPMQRSLYALRLDGTVVWTVPVSDVSGSAACSAADLDGDGAAEVVYADEEQMVILDGRTGAVLHTEVDHSSGTLFEYPTVVDADGDGAAEILLPSNTNNGPTPWTGLTVFEHDGDGWMGVPETWPAHDRTTGRFDDAGAVLDPGPWWQTDPSLRAIWSESEPGPDVALDPGELCIASCWEGGVAEYTFTVVNRGVGDVTAGTLVKLYRDDAGTLTFLRDEPLPWDVPSGTTSASLVVRVAVVDVGSDGLVAVLESGFGDCDAADETARFPGTGC